MFTLPKDEARRKLWIKFIQTKRADYQAPKIGQSRDHALCERHFTENCLTDEVLLMRKMGMKRKGELKHGSVPTIHTVQPVTSTSLHACAVSQHPKKKRACDKLEVARV